MIGTPRGVAGLALLTVSLGVATALTWPTPRAESRRLFHGMATATAARVVVTRAGQAPTELARGTNGWQLVSPTAGPVQPRAVENLLTGLASATWQRQVAGSSVVGHPEFTVSVDDEVFAVGPAIDASGSQWWRRADHAYLVDGWVADLATTPAFELRLVQPFSTSLDDASRLVLRSGVHEVVLLDGARQVLTNDGAVRLAEPLRQQLLAALESLKSVGLPAPDDAVANSQPRLSIEVEQGATPVGVDVVGACAAPAGSLRTQSSIGDICLPSGQVAAVETLVTTLAEPAATWRSARLLPGEPVQITLADGGILTRHGAVWIADVGGNSFRTNDDAVAELIRVLRAPWPEAPRGASAASTVVLQSVDTDGRTTTFTLWPSTLAIARGNEPTAMQLGSEALTILMSSPVNLRDLVLWPEELGALQPLQVVREGGATTTIAPTEAVANALKMPRARSRAVTVPTSKPRRTISATFAPPFAGQPSSTHSLELWPTSTGCIARVDRTDNDIAELAPQLCALLLKL